MNVHASGTSLQIRRIFDAPVERLFDCFTDPELLVRWWGPEGTTCPSAQVDLTPGGRYRLEILSADGSLSAANGEYLEIDSPRALAFTWHWDAEPEEVTRVTLRFQPLPDGRSELHLIHEHFPTEARTEAHGGGWSSSLNRLAALIGNR